VVADDVDLERGVVDAAAGGGGGGERRALLRLAVGPPFRAGPSRRPHRRVARRRAPAGQVGQLHR